MAESSKCSLSKARWPTAGSMFASAWLREPAPGFFSGFSIPHWGPIIAPAQLSWPGGSPATDGLRPESRAVLLHAKRERECYDYEPRLRLYKRNVLRDVQRGWRLYAEALHDLYGCAWRLPAPLRSPRRNLRRQRAARQLTPSRFAPWVSCCTPPHGNYTVVSGALPGGLTLDLSTGLISGVVTVGAGRTTSQSAFRIPLRPQPPAERHRSWLMDRRPIATASPLPRYGGNKVFGKAGGGGGATALPSEMLAARARPRHTPRFSWPAPPSHPPPPG